MAKIIIMNNRPVNGSILHQQLETTLPSLNDSFLVDFQEFSPNLYVFKAKDCSHDLFCEMVVELKEGLICSGEEDNSRLAPVVACSLPSISLQRLNEKTGFDGYLQELLVFQFHLKILEQFFLFCEQKEATKLILTLHGTNLDYLEVYSRFCALEQQTASFKGDQVQVVISMDIYTYDEIINFMDELEADFRKILWREQNVNPIFRQYLKSNSCLSHH